MVLSLARAVNITLYQRLVYLFRVNEEFLKRWLRADLRLIVRVQVLVIEKGGRLAASPMRIYWRLAVGLSRRLPGTLIVSDPGGGSEARFL